MDIFEAIEKRRSIRKYKPKPVTNQDLKKILEAGRLAPSGSNRQPWYFIVVRDMNRKKALSLAANNQSFIADADTVIVALGDPRLASSAKTPYKLSSTRIAHKQDPIIAIEHMILAATALGYGTCWIGAFNEDEVKKIVEVPENLAVVALFPIGVPDESPPSRPRKASEEIFFEELYGKPLKM